MSPASVVKLKQGSNTASVRDSCNVNPESLADGMVIAISNWGSSSKNVLSWLDQDRGCGANVYCDNGAATWSDVRICPNGQDFCE